MTRGNKRVYDQRYSSSFLVYRMAANWPGILSAAQSVLLTTCTTPTHTIPRESTFDTQWEAALSWCPAKLKKLHFRDHVSMMGGTVTEMRVKSLKLMYWRWLETTRVLLRRRFIARKKKKRETDHGARTSHENECISSAARRKETGWVNCT